MARDEPSLCPVELMRRAELLAVLRAGPRTPGELEAETSLSRSTVHRALESLVEKRVLREGDGSFELTGLGHAVATEITGCRRQVATADRLEPLLDTIGATDVSLPLQHLADAELTHPTRSHPHRTIERITDLLADTERIRLFSGVVSPIYLDMAYRQVRDGTEVEAIFDRRVVEILFSEYGRESREVARTGRFEIRIYDACPFELLICDRTVGIAAHDDEGVLRAFVESADPDVRAWAESLFDEYVERSEYATIF